jgi:hypothetical protein
VRVELEKEYNNPLPRWKSFILKRHLKKNGGSNKFKLEWLGIVWTACCYKLQKRIDEAI